MPSRAAHAHTESGATGRSVTASAFTIYQTAWLIMWIGQRIELVFRVQVLVADYNIKLV